VTLHQRRTHPTPVEGCFGCKASTIKFGQVDASEQKAWDRELDYYADLRKQGIQPAMTTAAKCEEAERISNETGVAYDATNPYSHIDTSQLGEL
jgi:hypothetical protein